MKTEKITHLTILPIGHGGRHVNEGVGTGREGRRQLPTGVPRSKEGILI